VTVGVGESELHMSSKWGFC